MGTYGNLPVTGAGALIVGGVAVAKPVAAVIVALALITIGVILRATNRNPLARLAGRGRTGGTIYTSNRRQGRLRRR